MSIFALASRPRYFHVRFGLRVLIGLCMIRWLSGCASIPDARPFAAATAQLEAADTRVAEALQAVLKENPSSLRASDQARHAFFDAAADYSAGLVALSRTPSDVNADALALSLSQLIASFAGAMVIAPAAPALSAGGIAVLASDGAAFAYRQIELVRAARTMAEAISAADPVIQRAAELLQADADDSEQIILAEWTLRSLDLAARFNTSSAFEAELAARRDEIQLRGAAALGASEASELTRIQALLASSAAEREASDQRLRAIESAKISSRQTVASFRQAIERWVSAHRNMMHPAQSR